MSWTLGSFENNFSHAVEIQVIVPANSSWDFSETFAGGDVNVEIPFRGTLQLRDQETGTVFQPIAGSDQVAIDMNPDRNQVDTVFQHWRSSYGSVALPYLKISIDADGTPTVTQTNA